MSVEVGILSGPAEHLGFRDERALKHQSGVTVERLRTALGASMEGMDRRRSEEEDDELMEAK